MSVTSVGALGGTPLTGAVKISSGNPYIGVGTSSGTNAVQLTYVNTGLSSLTASGSETLTGGAVTLTSANANLTITADSLANTLTFNATGSGGGGNWSYEGVFNTTTPTTYTLNDVVFDTVNTANTYICILGYTTASPPTPPSSDTTHWTLFSTNYGTTLSSLTILGDETNEPANNVNNGIYLEKNLGGNGYVSGLSFGSSTSAFPAEICLSWGGDSENPSVFLNTNATVGGTAYVPPTTSLLSLNVTTPIWSVSNSYSAGTVVISSANSIAYVANKFIVASPSNNDPSTEPTNWVALGVTSGNWSYKGVFNTTTPTTYGLNDVVFDTVNTTDTYVCILGYTTASPFTPPSSSPAVWKLFATNTASSTGMIYQSVWSNTATYATSDVVLFSGGTYICVTATTAGQSPFTTPASWQLLGAIGGVASSSPSDTSYVPQIFNNWYGSATTYNKNNLIGWDGGSIYQCVDNGVVSNTPPSSDTLNWTPFMLPVVQMYRNITTPVTGATGTLTTTLDLIPVYTLYPSTWPQGEVHIELKCDVSIGVTGGGDWGMLKFGNGNGDDGWAVIGTANGTTVKTSSITIATVLSQGEVTVPLSATIPLVNSGAGLVTNGAQIAYPAGTMWSSGVNITSFSISNIYLRQTNCSLYSGTTNPFAP